MNTIWRYTIDGLPDRYITLRWRKDVNDDLYHAPRIGGVPAGSPLTRGCLVLAGEWRRQSRRRFCSVVFRNNANVASPSSMLNWHGWQLRNRCARPVHSATFSRRRHLSRPSLPSKIERSDLSYFRPGRRRSSPWMASTSNRHNPRNPTCGETPSRDEGNLAPSRWDETTCASFNHVNDSRETRKYIFSVCPVSPRFSTQMLIKSNPIHPCRLDNTIIDNLLLIDNHVADNSVSPRDNLSFWALCIKSYNISW